MAATISVTDSLPPRCSPQRVPQSRINKVLAICPDVNPKDVARDLVITGSTARTINRILDGQFPAAINIEDENTLSDVSPMDEKKSAANTLLSRNSVMVAISRAGAESHNNSSSDTEKDTDSDDEEDLMVQEERKSLFSALKNRIYARESHKSCPEQSRVQLDRDTPYCKQLDSSSNKRPGSVKAKRTSSIVDLSFSENSDNDNDLCMREKCNHAISSCSSSITEATDCILVETSKPPNSGSEHLNKNRNTNNLDFSPRQETNFMDSHVSNHDTDICDDHDDFCCILPSTCINVSSESENSSGSRSCTPDFRSCSCVDPQDNFEIPAKRKKRTAEEIMSQKNEALRRKQAKEHERQTKKEAKEKEKRERQLAREEMKVQRDKEKLLKKADSMNQKTNRLDGCIKQILVCIDPDILCTDQLPSENVLLQKLDLLGAGHKVDAQRILSSITWQRAVVEHDVADTCQILTKTTFVEEQHAVLRLPAIKFVEMVSGFCEETQNTFVAVISDNENLAAFCARILEISGEKVVTLVIMGLEQYFKSVKLTQQRKFRNAVFGPSSSDMEKPSSKGRKKANKGPTPSVMVSRVDVEEALVDLQLRQPNCRVSMCETEEEFAELLCMFTKAVAEAPYKKKQPETFSFCVEGGEKGSVKVSKDGKGLKRVWQQHFQQFRNVSADMAAAIAAVYPTPQSLLQAYKQCGSKEEADKLLQDILVRRGAGVLATSRRIGPELSRRVHILLTSEDSDLSLK